MSSFISFHFFGRLDRDAARVEGDAFADEPEHRRLRRAWRIPSEDDQARRFGAAARHAEQQAHAELFDLRFVEDLDAHACAARNRGGALRELARRQRVPRLVGELPREIAALAENAPARRSRRRGTDRAIVGIRQDDRPGRRRRRRRIAGLVAAAVELRQREPFSDRLRELGGVALPADDKRHARDTPAARGEACRRRELAHELGAALGRAAADERHAARLPALVGDRRQKQVERLGLELLRRERPRHFTAGRRVDAWHWTIGNIRRGVGG
jgi:hypothetical protein